MATTDATGYTASAFYPVDGKGGTISSYTADAEGLDTLNDDMRVAKVAKGCRITNIYGRLGDFDSNGTPLVVFSIVTDQGSDKECIRDITTPQAGGWFSMADGTSNDQSDVGPELTADCEVRVLAATAPATAQTSGRELFVVVEVEAVSGGY